MSDSYLYLLAWVYWLGFLAAAPVGPVNMVAIHRGTMGRWANTVACGVGSAIVDMGYLALGLWGGQHILSYLHSRSVQDVLAGVCAVILLPIGAVFLVRAVRMDARWLVRSRRRLRKRPPNHLWSDVGTGFALTIVNPFTPAYWMGAAATWLARAQPAMGSRAFSWGLVAAGAGQMSWFLLLSFLVRFAPGRIGVRFFRSVTGACAVMLLSVGVYCLVLLISHHL
ncbi:MAG TPA: LysE family transporter [Phycisphaerae bacterium]|nr:LysE family transporter [Phycisphaerae bacterium]